jgi:hypothetical protein
VILAAGAKKPTPSLGQPKTIMDWSPRSRPPIDVREGRGQAMGGCGATYAFSRRLLSRAFRPFIGLASRAAKGRLDAFAEPSANGRYLREPDIADRDCGRNLGGGIAVVQASGIPVLHRPRSIGLRIRDRGLLRS